MEVHLLEIFKSILLCHFVNIIGDEAVSIENIAFQAEVDKERFQREVLKLSEFIIVNYKRQIGYNIYI